VLRWRQGGALGGSGQEFRRQANLAGPVGPARLLGALAVLGIWAFLLVFLLCPLARIFYDAVTDDAGALTRRHLAAFLTDGSACARCGTRSSSTSTSLAAPARPAALGVVLIRVAATCLAVINRLAGARMGGMFG
jgi:hypothetical protein